MTWQVSIAAAAILVGSLHPAAAADVCDPNTSDPQLIRACLLTKGWKNPDPLMIEGIAADRRVGGRYYNNTPTASPPALLSAAACDPNTSNPHLIRECLLSQGMKSIDPAMVEGIAAARRAADPQAQLSDDATALADALVPPGSYGGGSADQIVRDRYRQDVLKFGKQSVAICAPIRDGDAYRKCLNVRAVLAH